MKNKITKIIFGCAPLGIFDMGEMLLSETMEAVEKAFDSGITTFDCADIYGLGEAEINLAKALGPKIRNAHIITKFGVAWNKGSFVDRIKTYRDCSKKHMNNALDNSLKRLGCEQIGTYFVHWPDGKTTLSEISDNLEEVKKMGKIGSYGFSNFPSYQIIEALEKGESSPTWIQTECNLLSNENNLKDLQKLKKYGIKIMGYGTLAQGYLSGKFTDPPKFKKNDRRFRMSHFQPKIFLNNKSFLRVLQDVANEEGLTMSQTAVAWCIGNKYVDSVIIGIKKYSQLKEFIFNNDVKILETNMKKLNNARSMLRKNIRGYDTLHEEIK